MSSNLAERWNALEFKWASFYTKHDYRLCYLHHPNCTCWVDIMRTMGNVFKMAVKYYVFFHAIPLVMRLKKSKNGKAMRVAVVRSVLDYIKSIMFMVSLVGISKACMCLKTSLNVKGDGYYISWMSALSSSSILWEARSRQTEIAYFILAKACRAFYISLKRFKIFSFKQEAVVLHVVIMALITYVFHQKPEILKFNETLELIWGKD